MFVLANFLAGCATAPPEAAAPPLTTEDNSRIAARVQSIITNATGGGAAASEADLTFLRELILTTLGNPDFTAQLAGPQSLGGIDSVVITIDGNTFNHESRVDAPKGPSAKHAPGNGHEYMCLDSHPFPDLGNPQGNGVVSWSIKQTSDTIPTEPGAPCGTGGNPPAPSHFQVTRCDTPGNPCPPSPGNPTPPPIPATLMMAPGIYKVVSKGELYGLFGGHIGSTNSVGTVYVRPVNNQEIVETWCYDQQFYWPALKQVARSWPDEVRGAEFTKIEMINRNPGPANCSDGEDKVSYLVHRH